MPFAVAGWAAGCSRLRASHGQPELEPRESSHELALAFRVQPTTERPRGLPIPKSAAHERLLPRGLFPFSVSPHGAAAYCMMVPNHHAPAPSGFLDLLALSSAPSLPALFHAGSALGVHPSEPSSSRAAVPRLRGPSPHAVDRTRRSLTGSASIESRASPRQERQGHVKAPRATSTSGSCSARESATDKKRVRSLGARSSLGFSPLQGAPSPRDGSAFTEPPLLRFSIPGCRSAPRCYRSRVSLARSPAGLSRDCRPS